MLNDKISETRPKSILKKEGAPKSERKVHFGKGKSIAEYIHYTVESETKEQLIEMKEQLIDDILNMLTDKERLRLMNKSSPKPSWSNVMWNLSQKVVGTVFGTQDQTPDKQSDKNILITNLLEEIKRGFYATEKVTSFMPSEEKERILKTSDAKHELYKLLVKEDQLNSNTPEDPKRLSQSAEPSSKRMKL